MKNWAIFVGGVFHSRYKRRSDADGNAAFLRQSMPGKLVEVVWDVESVRPLLRMALLGTIATVVSWGVMAQARAVYQLWILSPDQSHLTPIEFSFEPEPERVPQPWYAE